MGTPKRFAVIDLGSNTFHLIVFDLSKQRPDVLFRERVPVKIGEGIEDGIITEAASTRATTTLFNFSEKIKEYHVVATKAIATSAFRSAINANEFCWRVRLECGIDIEIIDGNREAQLIYQGVKEAVIMPEHNSVIMDIGGGSVEFIICNKDGIIWKKSYEIGGIRLMKRFHKSEPIESSQVERLNEYLDNTLSDLYEKFEQYQPKTLIGASGAFESLVDISSVKQGKDPVGKSKIEGSLGIDDFQVICEEIISKSYDDRKLTPGLVTFRAEMIVVSCLLVKHVIKHGIDEIKTSAYALKEGMVSELLAEHRI